MRFNRLQQRSNICLSFNKQSPHVSVPNVHTHFYTLPSLFRVASLAGKSRHYPRYSLNSSDNEDSPIHRSIYAQPYNAIGTAERQSNFTYRTAKGGNVPGAIGPAATTVNPLTLNTPSSENGSSATLTDAEASLARENTLLVNNGELNKGKTRENRRSFWVGH